MISEFEVSTWQFDLRHVARSTVTGTNPAEAGPGPGGIPGRLMAGLASFVIVASFAIERLVGAVTPNAADSSIIRVALATEQSVRLKSNVESPVFRVSGQNLLGAAMARATELLTDLVSAKRSRIKDELAVWPAGPAGGNVSSPGSVAGFAGDTGDESLRIESRVRDSIG